MPKKVRLPDDSDLPDSSVFGEHEHVAAFLVYADDFLAAGEEMFYNHFSPDYWRCGEVVIQII